MPSGNFDLTFSCQKKVSEGWEEETKAMGKDLRNLEGIQIGLRNLLDGGRAVKKHYYKKEL